MLVTVSMQFRAMKQWVPNLLIELVYLFPKRSSAAFHSKISVDQFGQAVVIHWRHFGTSN